MMRDMTVGLALFGLFTIFGFIIGIVGGFLSWSEGEPGVTYDVYKWTDGHGDVVVTSFSDFKDAVKFVNTRDYGMVDHMGLTYKIVVCHDWCRTVYP